MEDHLENIPHNHHDKARVITMIQNLMPCGFNDVDQLRLAMENGSADHLDVETFMNAKQQIGNQANVMHFRGFDINNDLNDEMNAGDLKSFADNIRSSFCCRRSEYLDNLLSIDNIVDMKERRHISDMVCTF